MDITQMISQVVLGMGILCVIISVITELTKGIGFLDKIPTKLQVLVLSVILTVTGFFAYAAYVSFVYAWYHVAAAFIASFFVAFITINGWDALTEIIGRFIKKEDK